MANNLPILLSSANEASSAKIVSTKFLPFFLPFPSDDDAQICRFFEFRTLSATAWDSEMYVSKLLLIWIGIPLLLLFFVLLRSDCPNLVQFDKISFCFFSYNMPLCLYNIFPICVVSCRIWISESHNIIYLFPKRVSFQELWSFHYYLSEMKPILCAWDRDIMLWDSKILRARVPSEIHTSQWARSWFLVLKCKPWTTMRERERERERFYEALT